jgi:hypothetical protein
MRYQDIAILMRFRASYLGLGHNAEFLDDDQTMCRQCESALETERNLIFECEATQHDKGILALDHPWLRMEQNESDTEHMIRVSSNSHRQNLAKVIRFS